MPKKTKRNQPQLLDLFTSIADLGKIFHVRVTPKASSDNIKISYEPDGVRIIRIYVTALPEDGKANKAVIALLAKYLVVPKANLKIVKGHKTRDKAIELIPK